MRFVTWSIRLLLFVLLLVFAAKNTETATLRFIFDVAVSAPLVVWLFAFFVAGALIGVLASLGVVFRQRREIARLKREARRQGIALESAAQAETGQLSPPIVDA
ncbi:MAG: LapA family protein [Betaproteobacteria bacterium]|nr:LapA family protein [Betaproteobacteria bacterium]